MSDLDSDLADVDPRIQHMLESRSLFLRKPVPGDLSASPDMIHVIWDPVNDGLGLPVGSMFKGGFRSAAPGGQECWDAHAATGTSTTFKERVATVPGINQALEAILRSLHPRYT